MGEDIMAANREDIERWLEAARQENATHVIIVCDTYDWDDYPVDVYAGQDVRKIESHYNGKNMQKVMEVYSLTGKHSIEEQLNTHRAFFYD